MGNVEIERLIILLPIESALLEYIFSFFKLSSQNLLLNSYIFLLLSFKWAFKQLRDIKTPFIFLIIFSSKCGLLTELIFAGKEVANSDYRL